VAGHPEDTDCGSPVTSRQVGEGDGPGAGLTVADTAGVPCPVGRGDELGQVLSRPAGEGAEPALPS
jgi:hypothetical protein